MKYRIRTHKKTRQQQQQIQQKHYNSPSKMVRRADNINIKNSKYLDQNKKQKNI